MKTSAPSTSGAFPIGWASVFTGEGGTLMSDKAGRIGSIVEIMKSEWDLPTDCNEGELYAYAEMLLDRIEAGQGRAALHAFLAEAQVENLEMPSSDASRAIVDRAIDLVRASG
jgi:hypothetical protein